MNRNVSAAIAAIEEKKGENIVVVDLTSLDGAITDYFVICEAQSNIQVDAISNEVEKHLYESHNENPIRVEGRENGIWIIMDYGDIMVHIFERSTRTFYKLEELWSDAPQTQIESKY